MNVAGVSVAVDFMELFNNDSCITQSQKTDTTETTTAITRLLNEGKYDQSNEPLHLPLKHYHLYSSVCKKIVSQWKCLVFKN